MKESLTRTKKQKNIFRIGILILAIVFVCIGLAGGEAEIVLNKAIHICFECIGLG